MRKMKKPFTINMLPEAVFNRWFLQRARNKQSWIMQAKYLSYAANYLLKLHQKARDTQVKLLLNEMKKNGGRLRVGSRPATKQEIKLIYDSSVISVYRMLMGYSIENLAKAFLIEAQPSLIGNNGIIHKSVITSHLSVTMIEGCNIKLKVQEKDIVKMLSWYVVWAGRYPVPLKTEHTKPYERYDGLWFQPGDLQMQGEIRLIEIIYSKLLKTLM